MSSFWLNSKSSKYLHKKFYVAVTFSVNNGQYTWYEKHCLSLYSGPPGVVSKLISTVSATHGSKNTIVSLSPSLILALTFE